MPCTPDARQAGMQVAFSATQQSPQAHLPASSPVTFSMMAYGHWSSARTDRYSPTCRVEQGAAVAAGRKGCKMRLEAPASSQHQAGRQAGYFMWRSSSTALRMHRPGPPAHSPGCSCGPSPPCCSSWPSKSPAFLKGIPPSLKGHTDHGTTQGSRAGVQARTEPGHVGTAARMAHPHTWQGGPPTSTRHSRSLWPLGGYPSAPARILSSTAAALSRKKRTPAWTRPA